MAVNATAIWRVRISGANTNGGGYDPGIGGAATDYSQQNAAQATGTNGAGSGTTTFTDATAANFTSAMVGNAINISGQGFYFVTAFTSATQVVVDRALGTFSAASWALGGGWADFWTNTTSSNIVAGNIVYILGSGTPNPSSYTYDYTSSTVGNASGSTTAGYITYANDPLTPGYKAPPDTTGGMPCIKLPNGILFFNTDYVGAYGLYCVSSGQTSNAQYGIFAGNHMQAIGCVHDQLAFDYVFSADSSVQNVRIAAYGCEIFSSTAPGSNGANYVMSSAAMVVNGCNIHDTVGPGIRLPSSGYQGASILNSIVAKCRGVGITVSGGADPPAALQNLTIDGNVGNGVEVTTQTALASLVMVNCIISNQTSASTSGLVIDAGSAAANSRAAKFVDYNSYYNNTANYTAINAGTHDTALGVTPYVASSTENYTLA